jgi:exodeoxyribonuclease VII large subunit
MSKIIFSVSELNQASQQLLENHFPAIWVEGEISNLVRPTSGHLYFSLKDPKAQVRCALFRFQARALPFELSNGLLVQALAKVSLYPDRGDYQLIVERVEIAGDGLLKKAFDALVEKLSKEGLFEERWKKPLPFLPKTIGVITSSTGAAIRDILSVLQRRFPQIPVIIYPTKVQGAEAAGEIITALRAANQHQAVEVLLLARGGGSLEDLWPFNEERVARAIFESEIPIVTGIGHEIDFTIADFVADKRAPTPSAAAELITPHHAALQQQFLLFETRLAHEMTKFLQHQAQRLDWLFKRLRHPGQVIKVEQQQIKRLEQQLILLIQQTLKEKETLLKNALRALNTVSPLATLARGYAIVFKEEEEIVIRSKADIEVDEIFRLKLSDGTFRAKRLA